MEDRTRRRARLFTIIGVVLALAAGGLTYFIASSAPQAGPPPEEKGPVVIAARDLAVRQAIGPSDVTIAQYPRALIPPSAATKTEEVVGKILTQNVARGEAMLPMKWAAAQGQQPFTVFPIGVEFGPDVANYRAMSISVADTNAVGGNLVAGDIVDVLATVSIDATKWWNPPPPAPPDQTRVTDFDSKIVLQNVPILAKQGTIYTIRITDVLVAEQLAYVQSSGGTIALVLRGPKDERAVTTSGTNFQDVFKAWKLKQEKRFDATAP